MPASSPRDAREAEADIRAAVIRLARSDGDGGAVIERAAIMAEGSPAASIEAWIVAHGGEPEAPLITPPRPGLYRSPYDSRAVSAGARPPRRYVLPAAELR